MKALGLIVEYNPFHNGHSYHLQTAKELVNAEIVIAVMSGNFLQRGEPALLSKWFRTKMALLGGVDIVFELPYSFATQKAEVFANGAISILDAAGCESLCFGSESGDIHSFQHTIKYIGDHHDQYEKAINKNIKTGVSYPKALSLAYNEVANFNGLVNLSVPNNILGIQYMQAIKKQNSSIEVFTIKRKNADYHDLKFSSETIASATSIRKAIFSKVDQIEQYVPTTTNELLKQYLVLYGSFHHWENYWPYLQFRILQTSPQELREIYEVEEGIENRLIAASLTSLSFQEFMEKIKTKRYTWTRLQRICTHILTNSKKIEMNTNQEKATYLRLLGMTQNGREYLNKMKKHFQLPIVSRLASYKSKEIELDIRAGKMYSFGLTNNFARQALINQEFSQPPIFINE
ncbi:MAG: nucleotidyltransferase [Bacillota bacterium]|nr:nucleotidyltransferase [Bacillota bacterium]